MKLRGLARFRQCMITLADMEDFLKPSQAWATTKQTLKLLADYVPPSSVAS